MIGPMVDATGWHVSDDGERATLALDRNGFLLARLGLDRDGLLDLAEDINDAAARIAGLQAGYLRVNLTLGHLLRNVDGWETGRTLCSKRRPSWSVDWRHHARPLVGAPFERDMCRLCMGIWRREARGWHLAAGLARTYPVGG